MNEDFFSLKKVCRPCACGMAAPTFAEKNFVRGLGAQARDVIDKYEHHISELQRKHAESLSNFGFGIKESSHSHAAIRDELTQERAARAKAEQNLRITNESDAFKTMLASKFATIRKDAIRVLSKEDTLAIKLEDVIAWMGPSWNDLKLLKIEHVVQAKLYIDPSAFKKPHINVIWFTQEGLSYVTLRLCSKQRAFPAKTSLNDTIELSLIHI